MFRICCFLSFNCLKAFLCNWAFKTANKVTIKKLIMIITMVIIICEGGRVRRRESESPGDDQ